MRPGDVAAIPTDARHRGFARKRAMLLVWGNADPALPKLYQNGRLPPSPAHELLAIRFDRGVLLEALVETNTHRLRIAVDQPVSGAALDGGDVRLVRAVVTEELHVPGVELVLQRYVQEIA